MEDLPVWDALQFRKALADLLDVLAQPAAEQIDWLRNKDLPVQELWFELDDRMLGLSQAVEDGAILESTAVALRDLLGHLDSLGEARLNRDSLIHDPSWQAVRTHAGRVATEVRRGAQT